MFKFRFNIYFYFNAIMLVAVEDEDTAEIKPGINPLADTKVSTLASYVLTTKLPCPPTYNPPATKPNEPVTELNVAPVVGVTATPPTNCGLDMYEL
jgi:hypothetical protein